MVTTFPLKIGLSIVFWGGKIPFPRFFGRDLVPPHPLSKYQQDKLSEWLRPSAIFRISDHVNENFPAHQINRIEDIVPLSQTSISSINILPIFRRRRFLQMCQSRNIHYQLDRVLQNQYLSPWQHYWRRMPCGHLRFLGGVL